MHTFADYFLRQNSTVLILLDLLMIADHINRLCTEEGSIATLTFPPNPFPVPGHLIVVC